MSAGVSAPWFTTRKSAIYIDVVRALLSHVSSVRSGRLLDIGCGYGHVAAALAEATRYTVTAIDKNSAVLDVARQRFPLTTVSFEQEDVMSLPYADAEFDVIVSTGYKCAASLPGALAEVRRVLKDDGMLIMDFQRHYHLYSCAHPLSLLKSLADFVTSNNGQFHFGRFGLRDYFESNDFRIRTIGSLYTWPNFLPTTRSKMLFRDSIGILLKPLLARILLVVLDPA